MPNDYFEEQCKVDWNEDQVVWDLGQIQYINKYSPERKGLPEIKVVKRYPEMEMGIRAHPDMNMYRCLKSMFIFYSAEFIFIWLYFGFAVYFWIQVVLIGAHSDQYGYNVRAYYNYMLILTIMIALSVTVTLIFLTFYCISEKVKRILEHVDLNF